MPSTVSSTAITETGEQSAITQKITKTATGWLTKVMWIVLPIALTALVSALITLGYSVKLVWKEKKVDEAVKLAMWTAGWLVGFILLIMLGMWLKRSYS